MPDSRINNLIARVEENDLGFTECWAMRTNLECGTLFCNPNLPDVFFDKLTNVSCTNQTMIQKALEIFATNKTRPFLYSLNYPEFEELLRKQNFILYDIQHVLKKKGSGLEIPSIYKITPQDSMRWSATFCSAYDCHDWIGTVDDIVKKTIPYVDYYLDESASSCVVLYEKSSILGLYCLGTLPEKRKQGFAKSLIDFSLSETNKRKSDFLMLETYERDNLVEFYLKLGFEEIYQKKIYSI